MEPYGADDLVALAKTTPVADLPRLIGRMAEATAIANTRLLAIEPTPKADAPQLIDRKEAAQILGVSTFFLENKRLPFPCQTRAGRKILYNKQKLEQYIRQGHVPYENSE
jgi:hypothetical protein